MPDKYKTVPMTPLTGIFDARTSVDQEPAGAFAWKQNFEISPDGKLRQCGGFQKPFGQFKTVKTSQNDPGTPCPYTNADWHNQGVDAKSREPVTLLFPSTSNAQVRTLFAGTKTKFIRLNEASGQWTVIGSGFAADGSLILTSIRWKAAELQDKIFLTNGFDKIQYHDISTDVMQPVSSLDTAGTGGAAISKAMVIVQYQGVIMLMNMNEGAVHFGSRIRWSDLNDGTNFVVSDSSISDYQDLDYGEQILNAVEMSGSLYVFTDRAIWRCNFAIDATSNQASLICNRFYSEPRNKSKCLAFPNTLVSTGLDLYYAGGDAIYHYNPYLAEPERIEWIYRSSPMIFDDGNIQIDREACQAPVADYWPDRNEIHFSWPIVDASPTSSLVPSCNSPANKAVSSGINRFTLVINVKYLTCDFRDYGMSAYANYRSDLHSIGDCNQSVIFLGAHGTDYCLKQHGAGYAREIYDPVNDRFVTTGYNPILRGICPFGKFDGDKIISRFVIDGLADGDNGTVFALRIGSSFTLMNPNETIAGCSVLWKNLSNKPIKCLMAKPASTYASTNVRPSTNTHWNFYYRGRYLYYEITIQNSDGTPASAGGVMLSRFEVLAIAA
jgi:hypothetical protein